MKVETQIRANEIMKSLDDLYTMRRGWNGATKIGDCYDRVTITEHKQFVGVSSIYIPFEVVKTLTLAAISADIKLLEEEFDEL